MPENKIRVLREIALWQSLNGQLLYLRRRGKPIKDADHESLQKFCFGNLLSSKVTDNRMTSDVPLSLVTDFHDVYFITVNLKTWTDIILKLIPGTYSLDIEKALAHAFKIMRTYDRKYRLLREDIADEGDDVELHKFYNEYMDAKEAAGMDLLSLVFETHRLKGMALKKILDTKDCKILVRRENSRLSLQFDSTKKEKSGKGYGKALSIYSSFCAKVDPHKKGNFLKWVKGMQNVRSFLEPSGLRGLKESVRNFAREEIETFDKESNLIIKFSKDSKKKVTEIHTSRIINICNTTPLFFLKHPLPLL
jgi:hypothetical protein